MIRFLIAQYRFGCRVGFGRRHALTRALTLYARGF
jgi:hypothetical protein